MHVRKAMTYQRNCSFWFQGQAGNQSSTSATFVRSARLWGTTAEGNDGDQNPPNLHPNYNYNE